MEQPTSPLSPRSCRKISHNSKASTAIPPLPSIRRLLAGRLHIPRRSWIDSKRHPVSEEAQPYPKNGSESESIRFSLQHYAVHSTFSRTSDERKQRRTLHFPRNSFTATRTKADEEVRNNDFVVDHLPFALRSQTMLSVAAAAQRDDIRFRKEGFELKETVLQSDLQTRSDPAEHILHRQTSPARSGVLNLSSISASVSEPSIHFPETSEHVHASKIHFNLSKNYINPSFASSISASVLDISMVTNQNLSMISGHSSVGAYTCEDVLADLGNVTESSFNEDSFLQMAMKDLGW
ncbi:unnamed protein product [Somion occarium]|uniref:Uncharacterized protein n=1 Tax=Somion occarium TaxID=3059160 RepID=A0ABP1DN39_9APHY